MRKTRPSASVVMPVYNAEPFLSEAIESILNQTCADFEFLVVNDGSIDNSLNVLAKYSKIDSRIKVFNKSNSGASASRNMAMREAKSDWIVLMDADDIAYSNRLETQLNWASEYRLDLVGSYVKPILSGVKRGEWRFYESDEEIKAQLLFNNAFANSSVIFRRSLLERGSFDEAIKYVEDYDLWCRFAINGAAMGNVPEVLVNYRIHENQTTFNRIKTLPWKRAVQKKYCQWYFDKHDLILSEDVLSLLGEYPETGVDQIKIAYQSIFNLVCKLSEHEKKVCSENLWKLGVKKSQLGYEIYRLWKDFNSRCKTQVHIGHVKRLVLLTLSMLKIDYSKLQKSIPPRIFDAFQ